MLDALRRSTRSPVTKLLFILLALSFGAWGVGDMITFSAGRVAAIEVGSVEVPPEEVLQEFKNEVERLQKTVGTQITEEQARQFGLVDVAVSQIVTRNLLGEAARELGMAVDDATLRRHIAANPAFKNQQGQFDPDTYRQAIWAAGYTEERYVGIERRTLLRAHLVQAVTAGLGAPATAVDLLYRLRNERRAVEVVDIPHESVAAPALPDDEALSAYHKANAGRFTAPEYRALTALFLRPADVAGDIKVSEEEIAESYEARIAEFQQPERRNVQQILFADDAEAQRAAALRTEGKGFAEIAAEVGKPTIDLGWIDRSALPEEISQVVFTLPENGVSEPVQSPLGWHMFQISRAVGGGTRPLEEVRSQVAQDLIDERATDRLFELANSVEDTLGGGASVEEAAEKLNLKAVKVPAIDARGLTPEGKAADNVPVQGRFIETAFQTGEGQESALTETEDGRGYFILRVEALTPPALKPFAEVKDEVAAAWLTEERRKAAAAKAEEAAERLRRGEPAAEIAAAVGGTLRTPPAFTRTAFAGADVPGPVAAEMFKGQPGAVATGALADRALAARLKEVIAADPQKDPQGLAGLRNQLAQGLEGDLFAGYVGALQDKFEVRVNRQAIDRQFQ